MEKSLRELFEYVFSKHEKDYGVKFPEEFKKGVYAISDSIDKVEDLEHAEAYIKVTSVLPLFALIRIAHLRAKNITDAKERIRTMVYEAHVEIVQWLQFVLDVFSESIRSWIKEVLGLA